MSKQKVIADKQALIEKTREEIDILNSVQQRLLYKYIETPAVFEYYGYIEAFNKDSVRFNAVASTHNHIVGQGGRERHSILKLSYDVLLFLIPVKKKNIPLILAFPYRTEECAEIICGKSKIKVA